MDILEILTADYQRFPEQPTFSIYAPDVYFKDPLTQFRGLKRYQEMIGFMQRWFQEIQLELHSISTEGTLITTRWTLSWTTPLPWQPRIHISGRSDLLLDHNGLICSHIDYWDCSIWNVLQQHFAR